MDNVDPDNLEQFFQAAEDYNSAVTMSNSMAFISQFGVSFFLSIILPRRVRFAFPLKIIL